MLVRLFSLKSVHLTQHWTEPVSDPLRQMEIRVKPDVTGP